MVKSGGSRGESGPVTEERAPSRAWLMGALAWLVPGAGHLWQGAIIRALVLGGAVWAMFLTGLWYMGGHLHLVPKSGAGVLWHLFGACNLGTGLIYLVCWLAEAGFTEYAELPTFEYGKIFIVVAGLLNYLAMLDAFDLAARRKP
ncbi:MAG: DUF6677 family protein [Pyrinomonadaceae bacterium]